MAEILIANIVLTSVAVILAVACATLSWLAAAQFAKKLGEGLQLLAAGSIVMVLNFLFGMADHFQIGGVMLPVAHPGWVHGTTILIALAIMATGFWKIYQAAVEAKGR